MTPEQKSLVISSWAKILPIQETAAELFYSRLFETYPEVKPYFKGDMREQGKKLMTMINIAVNGLDKLDSLVESLKQMGKDHVAYGIKEEDYGKVGETLLWMLKQGLGANFTADTKEAWVLTYGAVASTMIEGAEYAVEKPVSNLSWWQKIWFSDKKTS